MPRRPSRVPQQDSALRQARKVRNWTLERLVEEIDLRTPDGHSGVTPSMVSGWELGRHITSIGHRATLCDIYQQPPDVLFAHQDLGLTAGVAPRLLAGFGDLAVGHRRGRRTSVTTWPGSASRPPPGSVSTTGDCTAPTNGSPWNRSRLSRASTTKRCSRWRRRQQAARRGTACIPAAITAEQRQAGAPAGRARGDGAGGRTTGDQLGRQPTGNWRRPAGEGIGVAASAPTSWSSACPAGTTASTAASITGRGSDRSAAAARSTA